MGKALPVIEPAPQINPLDTFSPQSLTPGQISDPSEEAFESSLLSATEPITVPYALRNAFQTSYDETIFHNQFALDLDMSSYALPEYLQDKPVRQLLHYFNHVVATVMPWVDGPDNPWRTLMLPLTTRSPSLLLALLALSAEHYCSRFESTLNPEDGFLSSFYRDKSLHLLAQDLRTEIVEDARPPRQTQASGILATILVLCNLEMIRCDTATWQVHWKAARTITRLWTNPPYASTMLDETCHFLLKEAFVYDVFGSSTTFGDHDQIPGTVLEEKDASVFSDWLQLVQDVTCTERRRHDGPSASSSLPEVLSQDLTTMQTLHQKFEFTRDRSRKFSESFDFGTPGPDSDFLVLIDIFHYAGLAYSFQALLDPFDPAVHQAIEDNVMLIINAISKIQKTTAYQHDLVWPLFVVGTQSRHNTDTQAFAETELLEIMKSTGFSNCLPALEFLRRFWKSDPNFVADWRQLARTESNQGRHFLVI